MKLPETYGTCFPEHQGSNGRSGRWRQLPPWSFLNVDGPSSGGSQQTCSCFFNYIKFLGNGVSSLDYLGNPIMTIRTCFHFSTCQAWRICFCRSWSLWGWLGMASSGNGCMVFGKDAATAMVTELTCAVGIGRTSVNSTRRIRRPENHKLGFLENPQIANNV